MENYNQIKKDILSVYNDFKCLEIFDMAQRMSDPVDYFIDVTENRVKQHYVVTRLGIGPIQTYGNNFWMYSFYINDKWKKYTAIVSCKGIENKTLTPVFKNNESLNIRIDSGCETGQVFNDNTCECKEQLNVMLQRLKDDNEGIIIHIPNQDGRGLGIGFKLGTLYLQKELNLNTVEAASVLQKNNEIDVRTYGGVVAVLKSLIISNKVKIDLATNNPDKIKVFVENGFIVEKQSIKIEPTCFTKRHLEAKEKHLEHDLGIIRQKE
jgi:GTP cyclohydrolase II/3,4-dihydroxy 2-butanone 4-phosphate synthase/GTP cyclohydrolase II